MIQQDLRNIEEILHHPEVEKLLDFSRPIAVIVVAVLHFIPDSDEPAAIIDRLRRTLAPGSHLVLSQASDDGRTEAERAEAEAVYRKTDNPLFIRSHAQLTDLFAGFELVDPGVVWVPLWRPEALDNTEDAEQSVFIGGVGRLGD